MNIEPQNTDKHNGNSDESVTGTSLLLMSLGSFVIYLLISLAVIYFFHETTFLSLFQHGLPFPAQIGIGAVAGLAAALIIGFAMFRTPLLEILKDYAIVEALGNMRFSGFDRAQVSFFAGVGEEILFRGVLQPLMGIWLTSAIFAAIHGYFKFRSIRHILFGAIMFSLSVGLGFLYEWAGLIAAMTAHAVYDFVILQIGQPYLHSSVKNPSGISR